MLVLRSNAAGNRGTRLEAQLRSKTSIATLIHKIMILLQNGKTGH